MFECNLDHFLNNWIGTIFDHFERGSADSYNIPETSRTCRPLHKSSGVYHDYCIPALVLGWGDALALQPQTARLRLVHDRCNTVAAGAWYFCSPCGAAVPCVLGPGHRAQCGCTVAPGLHDLCLGRSLWVMFPMSVLAVDARTPPRRATVGCSWFVRRLFRTIPSG